MCTHFVCWQHCSTGLAGAQYDRNAARSNFPSHDTQHNGDVFGVPKNYATVSNKTPTQ